jgi:hypothetical protein
MMENNTYAYSLDLDDGRPIKDVIYAKNLMEAFNLIDAEYGLTDENFKNLEIERMKKG